MEHVAEVAAYVGRHPGWIVLMGAPPTDPDTEYGWIEPGKRVGWMATAPVYKIRRFQEKPSPEVARVLFTVG